MTTCEFPRQGSGPLCRGIAYKIEDGHAYCPHHIGTVRRKGSPYTKRHTEKRTTP